MLLFMNRYLFSERKHSFFLRTGVLIIRLKNMFLLLRNEAVIHLPFHIAIMKLLRTA